MAVVLLKLCLQQFPQIISVPNYFLGPTAAAAPAAPMPPPPVQGPPPPPSVPGKFISLLHFEEAFLMNLGQFCT